MKDGFYLSTYTHIHPLAYCYKTSARHDHNISLWKKNGTEIELVHYWELERITGQKHHAHSFCNVEHACRFINALLEQYSLTMEDMEEIWGTPGLDTTNKYYIPEDSNVYAYHNLCHLYSAVLSNSNIFYNYPVIGLSLDGGPDNVVDTPISKKKHFVGCYSVKGKMSEYFSVYSPGPLWNAAKEQLGMEEGTLMALASATDCQLINYHPEMILCDDMKSTYSAIHYVKELIDKVKGLSDNDVGYAFTGYDSRFSKEENLISMVAKVIQEMSIQIMKYNIELIIRKFNVKTEECYLSIAGGFALNCPSNSKIMEYYGFKGFYTVPCVSDTGMSMGVALYTFYKRLNKPNFILGSAFYGNCDKRDIKIVLKNAHMERFIKSIQSWNPDRVVEDISIYPVVWLEGRAEIGPRALGHRSIIADARNLKTKEILNELKQRQWWRPVAPLIDYQYVDTYFEHAYPSPYMLNTFYMRPEYWDTLKAICHLDYSARIQTADESIGLLYDVIQRYHFRTGIPILCNTSLNDKGEPIIDKIEEALNFALRKRISVVYINGTRLELQNFENYTEDLPYRRENIFEQWMTESEIENLKQVLNPYHMSYIYIQMYLLDESLGTFHLDNERDIKALKRIVDELLKNEHIRSWFESGQMYLNK